MAEPITPTVPFQAMEWLERLLKNVGSPGTCTGPNCKAPVLWVIHANGRRCCYNHNGEPHWATCPDRDSFRKRGGYAK